MSVYQSWYQSLRSIRTLKGSVPAECTFSLILYKVEPLKQKYKTLSGSSNTILPTSSHARLSLRSYDAIKSLYTSVPVSFQPQYKNRFTDLFSYRVSRLSLDYPITCHNSGSECLVLCQTTAPVQNRRWQGQYQRTKLIMSILYWQNMLL